ncbi:putative mediator of RNA polymerase II transcription subunit 30 [Montipora foliosa]|uniref:putative mediator of RNA polymerase II transcription subunit 30 n=1 Tax=Montipora foliosa TaxID=591990 RepID=UPI0035F12DDF
MMNFQLIFLSIIFSHCLEHVSSNNSTMDNATLPEIIKEVKQLNKDDKLTLLNLINDELNATDDEVTDPPQDEVSQPTPTVNNTNTGLSNYFTTRTTTDSLEFNSTFPTTNEQTTSEVPEVFTNSATTTPHPSPFSVTSTTNVRTNSSTSEETVIKTSPWTPETKLDATSTKRVLPTKPTPQLQKGQKTTSQNEISKEKTTSKDHPSPTTRNERQDKSRGDGLLGYKSNFPAIFMIILLLIVVIYFGYHNRNKIQRFIKTGYSSRNHGSSGYVKVKVEDEINLPHDANRHYVY